MNNNTEDFIESRIENIIKENNIYHVGKVVRINSFIIEATGLEDAFFFEKVYVGNENNIGYVDKIDENRVFIALVRTDGNIKIGDAIKTTGEALEASFSKNAMGMVVDAFGVDRMTGKSFNESKMIPIETPKIPIMDRTPVNRPLETGISSIDLMFPIGRGQRQLIIGDKKTGKTQILLDTIVNQKGKNVICIYVSIGKTKKEVKRLYSKLVEKGANAYTQIVAVFNDDTSPLIKLTPYVGLSIAEEYMREGYDVLVCIDDLKKHADSCREIALISGKNTGREAYPADIFYTHSRLLEKGCQYKNGGSITILPVVETKGGDITDYISTNIISITDGQIVLSEKNFKKGQKPALDFGLSVSRLGGAVQKDSIKKVGAAVRRELLTYLETADVYQLVKIDAMSKELQEKVFRGKKLLSLLCQPKFSPRSEEKLVSNFGFILEETSLANSDTQTTSNDPEILDMDRNVEEVNEVVEEQNVVQNIETPVETPVMETTVEEPVQTPEVVNEWAPVETPVVETVVEEPIQTPEVVNEWAPAEVPVVENTVEEPVQTPEVVNEWAPAEVPVVENTVEEPVQTPEVVNEWAPVEAPVVENIVEEPVQTSEVVNEWAPVEAPVVENTVEEPVQTTEVVNEWAQVEAPVVETVVEEQVQTPEVVNEWAQVETPVVETVEEPVATFVPAEEQTNDGTVITDVEQLYTTEIPVEAIKQVLNEDIEQLRTTEIPVNEINEAAAEEEIEQLYTTEIPIIQQVEPFEIEENAVPVIEQSYTVEIPKLGTDYVTNTNETTTPEITFVYPDSNSDNNGVN